jgi:hypothetical protein
VEAWLCRLGSPGGIRSGGPPCVSHPRTLCVAGGAGQPARHHSRHAPRSRRGRGGGGGRGRGGGGETARRAATLRAMLRCGACVRPWRKLGRSLGLAGSEAGMSGGRGAGLPCCREDWRWRRHRIARQGPRRLRNPHGASPVARRTANSEEESTVLVARHLRSDEQFSQKPAHAHSPSFRQAQTCSLPFEVLRLDGPVERNHRALVAVARQCFAHVVRVFIATARQEARAASVDCCCTHVSSGLY